MSLRFLTALVLTLALSSLGLAKPKVVTSNTLLWDLAREVAGDAADCSSLIPLGVDPHAFQPAPSDMRRLAEAQVVVVNGLGLEPWLEKQIQQSGFKGEIVVASAGVKPLLGACEHEGHDHADHEHEGEYDPHAWHDLNRVATYVTNIRDGLVRAAPDQAAGLQDRTASLLDRIQKLDTEARTRLSALPAERRKLVTSHDALGYLGDAYGLTIIPIAGLRPDREPSAREMARLVTQIRREQVRAVFIESTSNPKIPSLLAREAGVTVVTELYTDSLGVPGSPGETFLGMFRHNLDTLVASLQR